MYPNFCALMRTGEVSGIEKNRTSFSTTVYLSCILMMADGQAATESPDNLIFAR